MSEQMKSEKRKRILPALGILLLMGINLYCWITPDYLWRIKKGVWTIYPRRTLLMVCITAVGIYTCLAGKIKRTEKQERIRSIVIFLLTPAAAFFLVEFANIAGPNLLWRKLTLSTIYRSGLNVMLMLAVLILVWVLTNSMKFAGCFLSIFLTILTLVCQFVYKFRRVPLLASDIETAGTAMNVMGNYDYSLRFHDKIMIFGCIVWCICLLSTKTVKLLRGRKRILAAGGYTAAFLALCWIWVYTPVTEWMNIKVNTYLPIKTYRKSGTFLNVVTSFHLMVVEKPQGYSPEAAEEIAAPYRELAASQEEGATPNVIVIMDEAFSDLQSVGEFETSEELMPFYKGLKENAVKGYIYVPYFGAQTANTEFEFLTGLTKAFLPAAATPYQIYLNAPLSCLNTELIRQGYEGILALHPFYENGYNRERAYEELGFRDFISIEDMEYEDTDLLREFISDYRDMEMVVEEYEKARTSGDGPFYLFNVTMQNHSGYDTEYENFEEPITIESAYDDPEARQYVNLIRHSDEALKYLVTYFEKVNEPTVIVFFGDHEPSLPDSFYEGIMGKTLDELTNEENMERYRTPFLIWANYDIEEQEGIRTSSNYLSLLMKKAAGMKLTAFDCFLEQLWEEVPVLSINGYFDKNGKYYEVDDKDSPYREKLWEYQTLEYNTLFDMENRIENFFD